MIVAVLRVAGAKFDIDRFLQHYAITADTAWRGGVADSVGRVRSDSGFNLTIADAPLTPQDMKLVSAVGVSLSVTAYPASDR